MFEPETLADTILFLLEKQPNTEPAELVALIYIADMYHLILYGRTVTESIKNKKYMLIEPSDMDELCKSLKDKTSTYQYLSETDKDSLEFAISRRQIDGFQDIPMCFGINKESEIINKVSKLAIKISQIEQCHSKCKNWPCGDPEKCYSENFRFLKERHESQN
jgi:hypothetical protein